MNKLSHLLGRPRELPDRVRHKLENWHDRSFRRAQSNTSISPHALDDVISTFLDGFPKGEFCNGIEDSILRRQSTLESLPFAVEHNGTQTLGRLCYTTCKALRPSVVVETGVAYGVTSAYILQALAENGHGKLYSIDLPPLAASCDNYVGYLIPPDLRSRWELRVGAARTILPDLLQELGEIDVFLHDSLHTYSHMSWEFRLALQHLRPAGALLSDDIQNNTAFTELRRLPTTDKWFAIQQDGKNAICGALRTR